MVERAIAAEVPFAWVVGDSIYGVSEIEMALRRAGKGYVLGVNSSSQFNSWGTKPSLAELLHRRNRRLTAQDTSGVQAQGSNSPRRWLGQLLTSLVNTSVR
jgi:SRSO17 transposase